MITTLTHDDGSTVILTDGPRTVSLSIRSPEAPTTSPAFLTLPELEALTKALGVMAAKLRGQAAKVA